MPDDVCRPAVPAPRHVTLFGHVISYLLIILVTLPCLASGGSSCQMGWVSHFCRGGNKRAMNGDDVIDVGVKKAEIRNLLLELIRKAGREKSARPGLGADSLDASIQPPDTARTRFQPTGSENDVIGGRDEKMEILEREEASSEIRSLRPSKSDSDQVDFAESVRRSSTADVGTSQSRMSAEQRRNDDEDGQTAEDAIDVEDLAAALAELRRELDERPTDDDSGKSDEKDGGGVVEAVDSDQIPLDDVELSRQGGAGREPAAARQRSPQASRTGNRRRPWSGR